MLFRSFLFLMSYIRDAAIRNRNRVSTSMLPCTSSTAPVSATDAMPSLSTMESREPNRPGMKWEQSFSNTSQSAMMVLVRSARSRLPKKDRGSLRSRSARVRRRVPLSL